MSKNIEIYYGLRSKKTGHLITYTIAMQNEKFCCGLYYMLQDCISSDIWLVDTKEQAFQVKYNPSNIELATLQYPYHKLNPNDIEVVKYTKIISIISVEK